MSNLPAPTAIIFDWDNTLVNTWPIIHQALNETFDEYGMEHWSMDKTMAQVSKSMRDSFPSLFGERWKEAGDRYRDHYRSHHLDRLTPLPGAEELLRKLFAQEIPLFVVSNKLGPSLREEVEHLGWRKYFAAIVGADDAARDKPYADPVHLALSNLEMQACADIWFVGDSEVDLAAAAASGCTPILYGLQAAAHASFTPTHYRDEAYSAHVADHALLDALVHRHL